MSKKRSKSTTRNVEKKIKEKAMISVKPPLDLSSVKRKKDKNILLRFWDILTDNIFNEDFFKDFINSLTHSSPKVFEYLINQILMSTELTNSLDNTIKINIIHQTESLLMRMVDNRLEVFCDKIVKESIGKNIKEIIKQTIDDQLFDVLPDLIEGILDRNLEVNNEKIYPTLTINDLSKDKKNNIKINEKIKIENIQQVEMTNKNQELEIDEITDYSGGKSLSNNLTIKYDFSSGTFIIVGIYNNSFANNRFNLALKGKLEVLSENNRIKIIDDKSEVYINKDLKMVGFIEK